MQHATRREKHCSWVASLSNLHQSLSNHFSTPQLQTESPELTSGKRQRRKLLLEADAQDREEHSKWSSGSPSDQLERRKHENTQWKWHWRNEAREKNCWMFSLPRARLSSSTVEEFSSNWKNSHCQCLELKSSSSMWNNVFSVAMAFSVWECLLWMCGPKQNIVCGCRAENTPHYLCISFATTNSAQTTRPHTQTAGRKWNVEQLEYLRQVLHQNITKNDIRKNYLFINYIIVKL